MKIYAPDLRTQAVGQASTQKPDMEGIIGLRLPELLPGEEAFTERRHAEIDKGVPKRRTAMTAANSFLEPKLEGLPGLYHPSGVLERSPWSVRSTGSHRLAYRFAIISGVSTITARWYPFLVAVNQLVLCGRRVRAIDGLICGCLAFCELNCIAARAHGNSRRPTNGLERYSTPKRSKRQSVEFLCSR